MNKKWAVLLVGIFFIGKAEAKLGQTLDEIKKGLNNKELVPVEEKTYPKDIIMYKAENVRAETGGFDFVRYSFFKDQEKRGNNCIRVNYHKIYEKMDEVPLLKNVESTISKNFGQDISSWEKIKSDCFHEDKNVPEASLGWYGPCEERALATISEYSENKKVSLTVVCNSAEYSEFETEVNYKAKSFLSKLLHIPSDKMLKNIYSNAFAGKTPKHYKIFKSAILIILIIATGSVLGGRLFALGIKLEKKWLKIGALLYFIIGVLATTVIVRVLFIQIVFLAGQFVKNSEITPR